MILVVTATLEAEAMECIDRARLLQNQTVAPLRTSEFLEMEVPERSREAGWDEVAIAVEDNQARAALWRHADSIGLLARSLIHPSSMISPSASIGPGSVVLARAVVNASGILGRGCILGSSSSVDHDCVLGDYVHLYPGVSLGGLVNIGRFATLHESAFVLPTVTIGEGARVGVRAVVLKHVPAHVFVSGIPARRSQATQPI